MKRLILICAFCFPLFAIGQTQFVKLNTTYILTTKPVVGFSYEAQIDSSRMAWSSGIEIGRYAYEETNLFNHSIESYSLRGIGATADIRYYIGKKDGPFGFFTSAFLRARYLKETEQSGVGIRNGGYSIDNPDLREDKGSAINYGLAIGVKTGCGDRGIHFEALAGYGYGHDTFKSDAGSDETSRDLEKYRRDFLRLELLLGVSF